MWNLENKIKEWQEKTKELPAGDELAEIKRRVSDIRDLMIKAEVAGLKGKSPEKYFIRISHLLSNLENHGKT